MPGRRRAGHRAAAGPRACVIEPATSHLHQVLRKQDLTAEILLHPRRPPLLRDSRIIAGHEMRQHDGLDACGGGDAPDVFGNAMAGGEMLAQVRRVHGPPQDPVQSGDIHHFVHQHVGAAGETDEIGTVGRVAGDDDGAVGGVEAVGVRLRDRRMDDAQGGDLDVDVLHDQARGDELMAEYQLARIRTPLVRDARVDIEHHIVVEIGFVRGVIDSADLPLNVSREILQSSRDIDAIKAGSVKKVLGMLEDMAANQPEQYTTFWKQFGKVMKEGPGEDFANKEKIAGLLRFASTHTDTDAQVVSLKDYIGRMKEGQTAIYYITADSFAAAQHSPHLEIFHKKGIEVLLLSDRVDEWLASNLTEFDGKPLKSVAKGGLDLGELEDEAEKTAQKEAEESLKPLVERIKTTLGERVKDVRVTHRLTDSPACLVTGEGDMSANLERLLKAAGQAAPTVKPTLEINPQHALVTRLNSESDEARFADWSNLLFEQALLAEGGQLDDPASFVRRLNGLLAMLPN